MVAVPLRAAPAFTDPEAAAMPETRAADGRDGREAGACGGCLRGCALLRSHCVLLQVSRFVQVPDAGGRDNRAILTAS